MVVGFSLQVSKVLEMIDSLIARDKLYTKDLKLIRDEIDFILEDFDFYKGTDDD
tara:strand:- start:618 stop:779 length:162 start_codon:yes stop_codon:yes gene_type:complete